MWPSAALGDSGSLGSLLEKLLYRISRDRALIEPVCDPLTLEVDRGRLCHGVVGADYLEETSVPRCFRISHYDAIKGLLFSALSCKPYLYCHCSVFLHRFVKKVFSCTLLRKLLE